MVATHDEESPKQEIAAVSASSSRTTEGSARVLPRYLPPMVEQQPLLLNHSRSTSSVTSSSDSEYYGSTATSPPRSIWLLKEPPAAHDNSDENTDVNATNKKPSWFKTLDREALQFALRMAILITISALFVLCGDASAKYPSGMWVLVSVLFVSWFPSLDAASVMEKITQRLIGTFVGAVLGLGCGFFSLLLPSFQRTFLACCLFVGTFGVIFLAGECKVGAKKVIRRYAYATILCELTFCICMLPFGLDEDPKWKCGVWRVCNVIVGCVLGALGSVTVCPKSTTDVLHDKTARQVKLAGEAAEAVLHLAADCLAGKVRVTRLADELIQAPLQTTQRWKMKRVLSGLSEASSKLSTDADVALRKYEDAIADWNASKSLFPLAKFDPFNAGQSEERKLVQSEIAKTLARALRIHTTIVVLDGMIRSEADFNFDESELDLMDETGTLMRRMLTLPFKRANDLAAIQLFDKLEASRAKIQKLSNAIAHPTGVPAEQHQREKEMQEFKASLLVSDVKNDDDLGRGIPKFASTGVDNSLFFLQLVEHLILRSLRLFQAWKLVQVIEERSFGKHRLSSTNTDRTDDMQSERSLIIA